MKLKKTLTMGNFHIWFWNLVYLIFMALFIDCTVWSISTGTKEIHIFQAVYGLESHSWSHFTPIEIRFWYISYKYFEIISQWVKLFHLSKGSNCEMSKKTIILLSLYFLCHLYSFVISKPIKLKIRGGSHLKEKSLLFHWRPMPIL